MSSQAFLIRIEGVNFDATISDTNDLSTMRGGSLALLRLGDAVVAAVEGAKCVTAGASQALFRVEREGEPAEVVIALREAVAARFAGAAAVSQAELDGRQPPFSQLTVVVDAVVETADAPARLEAMNHARQLRQWTVAPIAFVRDDGSAADPFDGTRPANQKVRLPRGKVLTLGEDDRDCDTVRLSTSVAARRAYGRRARQLFYRGELAETWKARLGARDVEGRREPETLYSFTNSTEDIVAERPHGLPVSLETKIAVVYADGNAFRNLRERFGAEVFGEKLSAFRKSLLDRILVWYVGSESSRERSPFVVWDPSTQTYGLRLETLLWGGDELMFVMPSWLAVAFVEGFLAETKTWEIEGERLTHAIGVAIAHYKTPIRQLQKIARASADLAKEAGLRSLDTVTFDVFESLAPPDLFLGTARARVFLTPDDDEGHKDLAGSLALCGDRYADVVRSIERAKGIGDEAVPRSQLYSALRAVRSKAGVGDYRDEKAGDVAEEHFEIYARRAGIERGEMFDRIPSFSGKGEGRALAFDLAMTTALWDYVHPFAERLPDFPTEKA